MGEAKRPGGGGVGGQQCMARTHVCCGTLSGDDLHVSLHKGFKIRFAGIVPVSLEFTGFGGCLHESG